MRLLNRVQEHVAEGPWGQVLEDTNPGFQPFGYAGGLYDPDTGLVRFGVRDYDPATARWTCKDRLGLEAGTNLYGYCDQDPVNSSDQTGLDNEELDQMIEKSSKGIFGHSLKDLTDAIDRLFSKRTAVEVGKSGLEAILTVGAVIPTAWVNKWVGIGMDAVLIGDFANTITGAGFELTEHGFDRMMQHGYVDRPEDVVRMAKGEKCKFYLDPTSGNWVHWNEAEGVGVVIASNNNKRIVSFLVEKSSRWEKVARSVRFP